MKKEILLLDDDSLLLDYMKEHLTLNNYNVQAFQSPAEALDALKHHGHDLLITDVKMNEMTGDEVLNYTLKNHPDTGVIMITGFGNIAHSVNAIRKGAFDYITKPFDGDELLSRIRQYFNFRASSSSAHPQQFQEADNGAGQKERTSDKRAAKSSLKADPEKRARVPSAVELIGEHPKIKSLLNMLPQIAPTRAPILIRGESGTGKEVFAHLVQRHSDRANKPFIKINCANLPRELVESTLFGHVKGAFTGAIEDRWGAFYEADGGTLLLDEITEIDISVQAKLLRVLQEKEFKRIGSQQTHKVDVRIIATTNREIGKAIKDGVFRKDLYFRLNVFPISIPPLRERPEDIPLLADYMCRKYTEEYDFEPKEISDELYEYLRNRDWSGNVRELENLIQRGVIMSGDSRQIEVAHLQNSLFENLDNEHIEDWFDEIKVIPIEDMEMKLIEKALEKTNGNQKEAAKLLKISDRTIRNKLKK